MPLDAAVAAEQPAAVEQVVSVVAVPVAASAARAVEQLRLYPRIQPTLPPPEAAARAEGVAEPPRPFNCAAR